MAETERDEKVSAGYRALGGEEPPRALDEAILAAARKRPSRWRVPLSIAAVLVLAVGVTLRMLPQRPDAESVALAPQVMETPRPVASAPASAPAERRMRAEVAAKPTTPAPALAQESARAGVAADAARPAAAPATGSMVLGKMAGATLNPEAWLERIAELRKQNRKREADESLAEFRKRYPGYKIPEPLR